MPFDPLAWIEDELQVLEAQGLRRQLQVRSGPQTNRPTWRERSLINFGSNDYLGLANGCLEPAVQAALSETGWGSGASPLVTGRGAWHAQLERALAEFEGTESALLFPTGFAANVGTIAALVGKEDAVFSDAKNHASIVDGCRLSGAQVFVYPHADTKRLAEQLAEHRSARRRLIVTDSLFSMDGDFAPLAELANLAEQYDAMLMVDEAHATGVFGEHGRGVCELFDVEHRVPIRVGTLSKALGSMGGFVVGRRSLIDWLANRARPYIFSTAAPEALAVAGWEALRIVREEPQRRQQLLQIATSLREQLRTDGWNIGTSQSQIIPIVIGDPHETMRMMHELLEKKCFVPGIRPPSVPAGESLLRISLRFDHTLEMIEHLRRSLRDVRLEKL